MYRPELVTAPAEHPVYLEDAKAHCRVDGSGENALLESLIGAATEHLDGYSGILGRCLVTQTWKQEFDAFAKCLRLPLPAASITSIIYQDSAGLLTTVNASNYALQHDAIGSFVRFKDAYAYPGNLYQTKAVAVSFTAGYGLAAEVPAPIKAAILLLVGHWYANREAVSAGGTAVLPLAVDALITPFRRVGV